MKEEKGGKKAKHPNLDFFPVKIAWCCEIVFNPFPPSSNFDRKQRISGNGCAQVLQSLSRKILAQTFG